MIFLSILLILGFLVFFQKNEYKRSNFVKIFILFSLLVIPYFSSFFPKFVLYSKFIRLHLAFSIIYFIIFVVYFFLYHFKLNVPKYVVWFFIYVIFSIFNNFIQNSYRADNWVNYNLYEYIFPLAFIVLIENLQYNKNDIKRLIKTLSIVVIGTFVVSIIQFTINPFFYKSTNIESIEATYRPQHIFGSIYRSYSLFSGVKAYDVTFAVGYLFIIFLFLNLLKKNRKYLFLTILIFISGILTFGRDLWLLLFIASISFVYYKYKKNWILPLGLLLVLLFIIFAISWQGLQETRIYQERIISKTYKSRIYTPKIYFKHFFSDKPFFGYGESSGDNPEFIKYYHVIHILWFNIMFQNGIVGLIIYLIFLYHIYKRGRLVYKFTGNPVFIVIIIAYIAINFTAPYDLINLYANYFMFFYLAMNYKLYVEKQKTTKSHMGKVINQSNL